MKRALAREQGKPGLELLEEATHLLRAAASATLATYYIGAAPFVLGLLYFWADMSRSPFAAQHLAGASLGLALLFLWMKFWQALFLRRVRASISSSPLPALTFKRCGRIFLRQAATQPIGLLVLPIALVLTLPFAWVFAFYQNLAALSDDDAAELRPLIKNAFRQAGLWPRQNHLVLALLSAFAFCVFLNCAMVCFILPGLLKMLLGTESVFTRSSASMLNTTFFAAMFGLTYLCVDPLIKTVYALRCFYGDSIQSGEDLKSEIKQFAAPLRQIAALVVAVLALSYAGNAATTPEAAASCWKISMKDEAGGSVRRQVEEKDPSPLALSPSEGEREHVPQSCARIGAWCGSWKGCTGARPWELRSRRRADGLFRAKAEQTNSRTGAPALLFFAVVGVANIESAQASSAELQSSVTPSELDQAIQETVHQRKYAWRMPRENITDSDKDGQGILDRFLARTGKMFRQWLQAFGNWLDGWLRRLLARQRPFQTGNSGYGWILAQEVLVYGLVAAAVLGLGYFVYRILRQRQPHMELQASEPIQPAPDLSDENLGADQLPEDGWTKLARELLVRGELRLALRAFYLASLAHLAQRKLISLAKFKSNHDYQSELQRRGHSFPGLLVLFGEVVAVFDRTWYGLHEVSFELVNEFASKIDQIRSGQ